ncbi:hypothetical protein [uncultured Megamonas sp.]|uniref:hypothetical protein n=2 Tax=Selenomonadaceae TaxID=1843491 RepID=UPI0025FCC4F4|nr:hypothetical protein [uncultured Megamonas sp.]
MRKSLMVKFLILCLLLVIGAVFHILNVPQLMEEFVRFIAVIIALVMIKQVFDYFHEKRE